MKTRIRTLTPALLYLAVTACAGETADTSTEGAAAADAAPEMSADEQALNELAEYWATHYNMGHPDMVADVYTSDAWFLGSNGRLAEGREAIAEALGANADMSPQIEVTPGDIMVFGDQAAGWGTYTITMSAEGAPSMSYGGTYMTHSTKTEGEWKIAGHISNLTDDPPEGFEFTSPEGEPGPNEGTLGELETAWETNFNQGHPDMVADLYTADGMVSFSRGGPLHGRAAIAEALAAMMAENPSQIDINDLSTMELGEGWALDGGWYEATDADSGEPTQYGGYFQLMRQADDGSWKIHWAVSNSWPPAEM
jgi:uncharacterized protein (TIGR02246 family)